MSVSIDRVKLLREHASLNGIDFIDVDLDDGVLHVHFFKPVDADLMADVSDVTITGGDVIPEVTVTSTSWDSTNDLLDVHFDAPGDFSLYTLKLVHPTASTKLEPYFDHAVFSFRAGCNDGLDCAAPAASCPKDPPDVPAIDYLAKDFNSFRDALLAFSSLRYPEWQERSEADFGVMFLEALSSMADDLSYYQDRVAAEAYLETATERRSLVRLARLVDYEPRPATAARVLLRVTGFTGTIVAPVLVRAQAPDSTLVDFEIGKGLADSGSTYALDATWSAIEPHWWDDRDRCLLRGAKEMWVKGHFAFTSGQKLLLETTSAAVGGPVRRVLVTLAEDTEVVTDPLVKAGTPPMPIQVTRLVWRDADALGQDTDLTRTTVCANLVPATQGRRVTETFGVEVSDAKPVITRTGPNGTTQYLYTLFDAPLAWLAPEDDLRGAPQPEIELVSALQWRFRRSLLDAGPFDEAYTVDPVRYRPIGAALSGGASTVEYDGRAGDTIRFGDGSFGMIPDEGTSFQVTYRVGGGAAGNIAAGTSFNVDPVSGAPLLGAVIDNPFAATGGADPESDDSVRRRAPFAYRVNPRRAPRSSDYERFARELPWVQRSNTSFRHTGSWLAAVTTPDPLGSQKVTSGQRVELAEQIDRVRLAGRESLVRAPEYTPLDIWIVVCPEPGAPADELEGAIRDALSARVRADGSKGFFHPDHFTFGTKLARATLEAAVQKVDGVRGVFNIFVKKRLITGSFVKMPRVVSVAPWEILRVDSDPSRPEHGSVDVDVKGKGGT